MGCGAGLAAIQAARQGARALATDVNVHALRLARRNAVLNGVRIDVARADLLSGVQRGRLDSVAFNPPYLPTAPGEHVPGPLDGAFHGGAGGADVTKRFLDELRNHKVGRAWIVASSLQEPPTLAQLAIDRGFRVHAASSKRLSFESLTVYDLLLRGRGTGNV